MSPDSRIQYDGVIVVDKPRGITSHDVVARIRRILSTRRVGHVGTLDPLATGVLPLVIGRATRLASLLSTGDKVYAAVFRLGVATDTYDTTGNVAHPMTRHTAPVPADLSVIKAASRDFVGTYQQTPPPFSAKKIGGVRAYRLARRQRPVEPAPVEVSVREFDLQALEGDRLRCRVTCAPGFYMRALAHDLGRTLGCGGCLEHLRRERSGAFTLEDAVTLDQLERSRDSAGGYILPMGRLLPELPGVVVTNRGLQRVSHGNSLTPADYTRLCDPDLDRRADGTVKVYDHEGHLLAIADGQAAGVLHPRIVLV